MGGAGTTADRGDSSNLANLIEVTVQLENLITEIYADSTSGNYKQLSKKIISDLKQT
jgi:hypothetical protein